MKKKFLSVLLVSALAISVFAGCRDKKTEDKVSTPQTEETTESVDAESTESVESTEVAEVTETEEQETTETEEESPYSYTDMSATMYAQRTVNVRDLPDTSGNKVGGLSTNQEVSVTGQCNETGWYRISYNGSEAFVSDKYLGESKVEVQQTTQSANTQSSDSQPASSDSGNTTSTELPSNPYTLNTVVEDTGSSVSFYCLETFTNGVSDGYPNFYDTAHQATEYIMNMGKTPGDEVCNGTVGEYKEGIVWKWTCYYN